MGEGLRLTAIGLGLGVGGALLATRLLAGLLYGVATADVGTYVAVAGLLGGVALVSSYLPARRAVSIEPTRALRAD
jgi:ABC-type lipoprotein release transport system permease subunit